MDDLIFAADETEWITSDANTKPAPSAAHRLAANQHTVSPTNQLLPRRVQPLVPIAVHILPLKCLPCLDGPPRLRFDGQQCRVISERDGHACTPPMVCVYFERRSYEKNRLGMEMVLCVRFHSMPSDMTSHFLSVSSRARNHLPFCRCTHLQLSFARFVSSSVTAQIWN